MMIMITHTHTLLHQKHSIEIVGWSSSSSSSKRINSDYFNTIIIMIITFLRFATCFFLLFLICFRTLFISNQKREEKKKDFHRIFVSSVYSEKTKTQHNSVITLSLSLTLHFSLATKPFIILIRKDFFFCPYLFSLFFFVLPTKCRMD